MKLLKTTCFIILLFLSACHTIQYVAVPVNYNPKSNFNPHSTTILLINQVDTNLWRLSSQKKRNVIKAAAYTSLVHAQNLLNQLPHMKVVNLVDSLQFRLTTDSIKSLALKYHANYVLALKTFNAGINLADFDSATMFYSTDVTVGYFLYESNGIYYKKLAGTANDPNAELPYVNIASFFIHPTVRGNKAALKTSAEHATETALQDYLPYTITHQRPLYTDDFLKVSVNEILSGNFNKAGSLLQPFLKDVDQKKAGKAAYNLSVVYEAEGDIDAAFDMAQQSLNKYRNTYAADMLNDLKTE